MIAVEKASGFPVSVACSLLGVSRSGFHDWQTRSPSDRELTDAWLTEKIKAIHIANRGVYGARRIHAELRMAHDIRVGKKRVAQADAPGRDLRAGPQEARPHNDPRAWR